MTIAVPKKVKPKKKPKKSTLKKKMDNTWSKKIRERANYRCEICRDLGLEQKGKKVEAAHVVGKGCTFLRWDLRNGVCACTTHHKFGVRSSHLNPVWFSEWFKKYRPDDWQYVKDHEHITMSSIPLEWYEDKLMELEEL